MTQRIEPFFVYFNNDSKNWTLCKWLIELSLFHEPLLNKSWIFLFLTQRIELFFWIWLNYSNPFFYVTQKLKFSVEKVKNETFQFFENSKLIFFTWLEELNPPFATSLRELNFFWNWLKVFFNGLEESNPFFFSTRLNESNLFKMWLSL